MSKLKWSYSSFQTEAVFLAVGVTFRSEMSFPPTMPSSSVYPHAEMQTRPTSGEAVQFVLYGSSVIAGSGNWCLLLIGSCVLKDRALMIWPRSCFSLSLDNWGFVLFFFNCWELFPKNNSLLKTKNSVIELYMLPLSASKCLGLVCWSVCWSNQSFGGEFCSVLRSKRACSKRTWVFWPESKRCDNRGASLS